MGNGRATCPFYEELDGILGDRPASNPPVVLESVDSGVGAKEQGDEAGDLIVPTAQEEDKDYMCYLKTSL